MHQANSPCSNRSADRTSDSLQTAAQEFSPLPESASPLVRTLQMTLAYDGTNYCGWQVQPNGVSLQAVVEKSLKEFTGEPIRVVASGRTDAGVHAIGQVISFATRSTAPCQGFVQGLPRHLPDDVVVRDVQPACAGFNARYDAKSKWYRYVIYNSPIRMPFLRHAVLWQRARLDHAAMHAAVQCLIGKHDFRCFETEWPNRSCSVRTVFRSSVRRFGEWRAWSATDAEQSASDVTTTAELDHQSTNSQPAFICFDIEADGFLYNMVRAIVGTLIHVGRGRWTANDMQRILDAGDRIHAGETAPPQGLYLMRVNY